MRCGLAAKILAALLVIAALFLMPDEAWALNKVTDFGSNPGNLLMYQYVPQDLPPNAPLVVALHGCTQSAANYDEETGWVKLADKYKFALLLPEQQTPNNSLKCFNWFEPGDIERGQGEALSIKQMIDKMKSTYGSDSKRVYVTGLSAGGAMTSVMLSTYPDVFAGGAIVAGLPYKCGIGKTEAGNCMKPGKIFTPEQWGDKVRKAFPGYQGPWPIVSIWHGDADSTVKVSNLTESLKQWTNVHGIDQTPDLQETVAGYPHKVYQNAQGKALVETYTITGMAHGTPIDPGTGEKQCGNPVAYILDKDICSSYYISQFWGPIKPVLSVKITSPPQGKVVSGSVPIEAATTGSVQRVKFYADGNLLGEDTTVPYTYSWNTANVEKGSHNLMAKAYDAADKEVTSEAVSVTVNGNSVKITSPTQGKVVSGSVPIEAATTGSVQRVKFYADGNLLGEDTTAPYTYSWNTANVEKGSHKLVAKAYDTADKEVTSEAVSVTVNGPLLVTFNNDDGKDGYVKAKADGSSAAVGTNENLLGLAIGRGADGKFNRAVLSFDTSSLPDTAKITKAYLTVIRLSGSGNPWSNPTGNQLVVDVQRGCFSNCAIEAGDWSAPATASSVAKFAPFTAGSQNSEAFNPEGLAAINKTGITQMKLRFSQNQTSTNYLWLDHGATAKLYVEYTE